jgi:uncharacterized protein (DUF39 family)
MLVFNQKIVKEINTTTSKGEPVVIKVKAEPSKEKTLTKNKLRKKVNGVTSGTFESKMHFAQSQLSAQKSVQKKEKSIKP